MAIGTTQDKGSMVVVKQFAVFKMIRIYIQQQDQSVEIELFYLTLYMQTRKDEVTQVNHVTDMKTRMQTSLGIQSNPFLHYLTFR